MSVGFKIEGGDSSENADVHRLSDKTGVHHGVVTLTERFLQLNAELKPFINPTYGAQMNQNISFGGTPEIIHNGGTSIEWTGSVVQGGWNFADAGKVSITNANDGDTATFSEENALTIDSSAYTTITGKITLTIYNSAQNDIIVLFDLAGSTVGNSVNLNDYIDTGDIGTEQTFIIPKDDFGLNGSAVDGFSIILNRRGGSKPTMSFDDIQFEETGGVEDFTIAADFDRPYYVQSVRLTFTDALSTVLTGNSMPSLSYDKILGLAELTNGITFTRIQDGITNFTITFKSLSDFISNGFDVVTTFSDGTNTLLSLQVNFPEAIRLNDNSEDYLIFRIRDNLSGLLKMTAVARGAKEI